jgi:hypothetical protein
MVDIFEEVNEELKNEEFSSWLKKYGPMIIILSIFVILFTIVRVLYDNHKNSVNIKQTDILSNIMNIEEIKKDDNFQSVDISEKIEASAKDLDLKHKFLAEFLQAAAFADAGKLKEANELYQNIIKNKFVSKEYKETAIVYFVQNELNRTDGNLIEAQKLIKPMLYKDNSFYYIVAEQNGLIEIKLGNNESAKNIFEALSNDEETPDDIKERAEKVKTLY